ncbi:hypothetical protein [Phytopseudomonas flavescens]|nr:hypothetical protein [Pseudomonas flavescens]
MPVSTPAFIRSASPGQINDDRLVGCPLTAIPLSPQSQRDANEL